MLNNKNEQNKKPVLEKQLTINRYGFVTQESKFENFENVSISSLSR